MYLVHGVRKDLPKKSTVTAKKPVFGQSNQTIFSADDPKTVVRSFYTHAAGENRTKNCPWRRME